MSFDPEGFAAPATKGGSSSYNGNSESSVRTVPLVLTILFALIAVVCTVVSFSLGTNDLTAEQESLKATLLMVGIASFVGLIVTGQKVKRRNR